MFFRWRRGPYAGDEPLVIGEAADDGFHGILHGAQRVGIVNDPVIEAYEEEYMQGMAPGGHAQASLVRRWLFHAYFVNLPWRSSSQQSSNRL